MNYIYFLSLSEELEKVNVKLSLMESWGKGGNGAIDLAEKIVELTQNSTKEVYKCLIKIAIINILNTENR